MTSPRWRCARCRRAKEPVMHVLESYLLLQVALLIGQATPTPATPTPATPTPAPRVLFEAAQPIAAMGQSVVVNELKEMADFPTKIWVQDALRETVARLWTTSPTFRRQCLQVQAAGAVQVQLRLD